METIRQVVRDIKDFIGTIHNAYRRNIYFKEEILMDGLA